jgi:hypothetical protein
MEQPEMRMQEPEFHEHVGEKNICHSVADALDRAKSLYPEVAKSFPAGTSWGRRSSDASAAAPRWQHHRVISLSTGGWRSSFSVITRLAMLWRRSGDNKDSDEGTT